MKSTTSHEDQFAPEPTPQEEEAWREMERRQQPESGLTVKQAWWAGYRAGKGLPADTPRQEAVEVSLGSGQERIRALADDLLRGHSPSIHTLREAARFLQDCYLAAQPQPSGNAEGVLTDAAIEALAKQYDCHNAPGFKGFAQEVARAALAAQASGQDREDAERYRFIRDVPHTDEVRCTLSLQQNAIMDSIIDAARAAAKGK